MTLNMGLNFYLGLDVQTEIQILYVIYPLHVFYVLQVLALGAINPCLAASQL